MATVLLLIGFGYTGRAIAHSARDDGLDVIATSRGAAGSRDVDGVRVVPFDDGARFVASADALVLTAPPDADGRDPALARFGDAVEAATRLRWIGYLSSTGVYGDRDGGTVDEETTPAPAHARARRRRDAELAWASRAAPARAVDLLRLAGIYGPGRSVFDDLRAGASRPIRAPGHAFGRIHRDDIASGVLAAFRTADAARVPLRVLNFSDDEPAESADVIAEAARLLGVAPPPERTLDAAWPAMSPMARSFWSDNRRVRSALTQQRLGRPWRYPTYREGLRAVLAAERGVEQREQDVAQQNEVRLP